VNGGECAGTIHPLRPFSLDYCFPPDIGKMEGRSIYKMDFKFLRSFRFTFLPIPVSLVFPLPLKLPFGM